LTLIFTAITEAFFFDYISFSPISPLPLISPYFISLATGLFDYYQLISSYFAIDIS